MRLAFVLVSLALVVGSRSDGEAPELPVFSASELRQLQRLSPLGAPPLDETNRFSGDARAAKLGQRLFFEPGLSVNGEVSCATCHDPAKSFSDGLRVPNTLGQGTRRTPPLWNLAYGRWYFHDGRSDSLWSQALQPIENPIEMGGDRLAVLHTIDADERLRVEFEALCGDLPELEDDQRFPAHARPVPGDPAHPHAVAWASMSAADQHAVNRAFADVGKLIAAYERLLVSTDAPFDSFVRGLVEGDAELRAALTPAAQRGARLFLGKGQCRLCHNGPNFSDGEFHGLGLAPAGGGLPQDPGRYGGVEALLADPFNTRGAFSDAPEGQRARTIEGLSRSAASWGEFKTPSLREVTRRGPYMHAGQFATLEEVLHFYSTLEGSAPLHQHQEQVLRPRDFSAVELGELAAFLESLEGAALDPGLLKGR